VVICGPWTAARYSTSLPVPTRCRASGPEPADRQVPVLPLGRIGPGSVGLIDPWSMSTPVRCSCGSTQPPRVTFRVHQDVSSLLEQPRGVRWRELRTSPVRVWEPDANRWPGSLFGPSCLIACSGGTPGRGVMPCVVGAASAGGGARGRKVLLFMNHDRLMWESV